MQKSSGIRMTICLGSEFVKNNSVLLVKILFFPGVMSVRTIVLVLNFQYVLHINSYILQCAVNML